MTAGRLILDDGELTCHRPGGGSPVVLRHAGGAGGARWNHHFDLLDGLGLDRVRPDEFDRVLSRFLSASR
jgi:hypothetical protein